MIYNRVGIGSAGILLLLSRPFKICDRIEISKFEDITTRYFIMSTDDNRLGYTPCNSILSARIMKCNWQK